MLSIQNSGLPAPVFINRSKVGREPDKVFKTTEWGFEMTAEDATIF
jgi:hypothetical protein